MWPAPRGYLNRTNSPHSDGFGNGLSAYAELASGGGYGEVFAAFSVVIVVAFLAAKSVPISSRENNLAAEATGRFP
jgi:hypothetical protein